MKINIENKNASKVPDVGEVWKNSYNEDYYMRMNDEQGKIILGDPEQDVIYSIDLKSGRILFTPKNSKFIILDVELVNV